MQVNLTVNVRGNFWKVVSSVTVIHRVTVIYRAVVYRFHCMEVLN